MNVCIRFEDAGQEIPRSIYCIVSGKPKEDDKQLKDRIMEFLRSDMVVAVRQVKGTYGERTYISDRYEASPVFAGRSKASGPEASDHKVKNLYFVEDAPRRPGVMRLLPGITGAGSFLKNLTGGGNLQVEIDLVWPGAREGFTVDGRVRVARGYETVYIEGVKVGGGMRLVITFYHPDWASKEGAEILKSLSSLFGFQDGR